MSKRFIVAALAALVALPVAAQSSHSVSVIIPEVKLFSVDSETVELTFATPANAGDSFEDVTAESSYDISVNKAHNPSVDEVVDGDGNVVTPAVDNSGNTGQYKITAYSAAAFGTGITVEARLASASASGSGTSAGYQTIPVGASNAVSLVTDIGKVNGRGRRITYRASATMDADPGTHTETVTYTLTEQ